MTELSVHKHIYGQPTFPDIKEASSALVLGSNGISGWSMINQLCLHPDRWHTVYSVSRAAQSPDDKFPKQLKHIQIDLLSPPEQIASILVHHNVKPDYVFFFAYIQAKAKPSEGLWSDYDEMTRVNIALLKNLLTALEIAKIVPKRFLLQTGGKQYGVHLGACRNPSIEDDPRVPGPPNFYYDQEDLVYEWAKKNGVQWNVARPSFVIGFARRAYMNFVLPFSIYAAVQKHLGEKMIWPADHSAYDRLSSVSTAALNAVMEEWMVLNPNVGNEAFNTEDGDAFTYAVFWPMLAKFYNIEYTTPADDEKDPNVKYKETAVQFPPPKGYGPKAVLRTKFTFNEWASQEKVKKAYYEIAEKQGLPKDYIDDTEVMGFGDACMIGGNPVLMSMTKARENGYLAYADSYKTFLDTIGDMVGFKVCAKP